VLVNLKNDAPNDYYVLKFSDFAAKIRRGYKKYIGILKRDGSQRKELNFRWIDLKQLTGTEKNSWKLIIDALK
jgi:recombinational DNA repair protein RecT